MHWHNARGRHFGILERHANNLTRGFHVVEPRSAHVRMTTRSRSFSSRSNSTDNREDYRLAFCRHPTSADLIWGAKLTPPRWESLLTWLGFLSIACVFDCRFEMRLSPCARCAPGCTSFVHTPPLSRHDQDQEPQKTRHNDLLKPLMTRETSEGSLLCLPTPRAHGQVLLPGGSRSYWL